MMTVVGQAIIPAEAPEIIIHVPSAPIIQR